MGLSWCAALCVVFCSCGYGIMMRYEFVFKGDFDVKVTETKLKGVFVLEPQVFGDARGWFMESWSKRKMEAAGISVDFVQDNQSYSAQKGTLRGLHY